MGKRWKEKLDNSIKVLLATKNEAVVYFIRRDFFGEAVDHIQVMWELKEPQKIIKKQSPDGSWLGPIKKGQIFPENHAQLVATFKAFRTLVERYQFTRESVLIGKAAEYIFSCQTTEGDIRGFIGNQYATYYTGYVLALLTQSGYADDSRVEKAMQWLIKMRQDDGGWNIPILTHHFDGRTMYRLTASHAEPVEPVRSQPFSHNWTDMVLRAFAVHPVYRQSEEARTAGNLLKSKFFQPDFYSSYKAASYWTRFVFWWPNLLTAMESLSLLGFAAADPDIKKGLQWFFDNRKEDGLWDCVYGSKDVLQSAVYYLERAWISLRICRMLKQFLG